MRDITRHLTTATGGAVTGYGAWATRMFGKPEPIGPGPNFQTPLFRKTWENYLKARDSK
jgi:hypothetical protein